MRLTILWGAWQAPLHAGASAMAARGHDVHVFAEASTARAPFGEHRWAGEYAFHDLNGQDCHALLSRLSDTRPEVVLVSGWHRKPFREVLRSLRGKSRRVLCMDNQWHERPRQWVGRGVSPLYVRPLFEAAFVPGERQAQFARRLGFGWADIREGLLPVAPDIVPTTSQRGEAFIYLGAREGRKGFFDLLEAYAVYRTSARHPWGLLVGGSGTPVSQDGVVDLGFLGRAEDVADALAAASAAVLVGAHEAWGIFLTEAAASGLALIAAAEVGATPHLVQDRYNGRVVAARDIQGISDAMAEVSNLPAAELRKWGQQSAELARPFSVERWCAQVESLLG